MDSNGDGGVAGMVRPMGSYGRGFRKKKPTAGRRCARFIACGLAYYTRLGLRAVP